MTTYVLVHGAWHGPWAWDRVVPLLRSAGARTLTPDLSAPGDHGLHDHAAIVTAALDAAAPDDLVLVGHSYAGLVVREAADARPDLVGHLVLVDGWAGPDGASLFGLAPERFVRAMRAAAEQSGDGRSIPAPPPSAYGIEEAGAAAWLAPRLVPQPLRSFAEPTRLSGAVERIPGTSIGCTPQGFPFDAYAERLGYRRLALEGPHDIMLTRPDALADLLLAAGRS